MPFFYNPNYDADAVPIPSRYRQMLVEVVLHRLLGGVDAVPDTEGKQQQKGSLKKKVLKHLLCSTYICFRFKGA